MRERNGKLALACLLVVAAGAAQAAGGHHDVDDASLLPRGECEQESWFSQGRGRFRWIHAGVSCRVGPVELGLAGENARLGDASSQTFWGLEVKWARELAEGFGVGLDVSPVLRPKGGPRYAGTAVYGIASWSPRPDLFLHANYGRDFEHRDTDQPRAGVALEWIPTPRWSFVGERYRAQGSHFARAGARWAAGTRWTLDLSRAQRIAGATPSHWTLGFSIALGGD